MGALAKKKNKTYLDDDIAARSRCGQRTRHCLRAEFMLSWTEGSMASSPHLPEAAILPSPAAFLLCAVCCVLRAACCVPLAWLLVVGCWSRPIAHLVK